VASAVVNGRIWVVGGLTTADATADATATAKVETYDPAADRWAPGPDLPIPLHHLALAVFRGELVVAGGFQGGGSGLYSRPSDRVLALRNGAWVDLPRLRRPRGAAAAAVVGDTLYVMGGRDAGLLIGPTEAFDGVSWQDRAAIPTARDHLAAVSDGHAVFAGGGRFLDPDRLSDAFQRYDPTTDKWVELPVLPTARGGLGLTLFGGRLVAAGGEDSSRVFSQVELFDLAAGRWTAVQPMRTPRHGLGLNAVGDVVYALVGGTAAGVAPSTVLEALTGP
jgi:non-specific serine/threonine protein kinase